MDRRIGVAVAAGDAVFGGAIEWRIGHRAFVHTEWASVVEVATGIRGLIFVARFLLPTPLRFRIGLRD